MKIEWQDFNGTVLAECNKIAEYVNKLDSFLENYCCETPLRHKIDRTLVRLSIAAQRLMDLVMPIPSTGEIFGLPREATENADLPKPQLIHQDRPTWDYIPWFCEKVTRIRQAVNRLMEGLEKNPEKIEFTKGFWNSAEDYIKDEMRSQIRQIRGVNQGLLEMFGSGKLRISDVRMIEEEE